MSYKACGVIDFERDNILYNEFSINQLDNLKFLKKKIKIIIIIKNNPLKFLSKKIVK